MDWICMPTKPAVSVAGHTWQHLRAFLSKACQHGQRGHGQVSVQQASYAVDSALIVHVHGFIPQVNAAEQRGLSTQRYGHAKNKSISL